MRSAGIPAVTLVLFSLTVCPITDTRAQDSQRQPAEQARSATVMVMVVERTPQLPSRTPIPSQGLGFLVTTDGHIVAQQPLFPGATKIEVALQTGERLAADLVGQDVKTGLALLKITAGRRHPVLQFAAKEAVVGDRVFVISAHDAGVTTAEATVSRFTPEFIEVEVPVRRGTAGGPVVNAEGEIVAILAAHLRAPDGTLSSKSYAVPGRQAARVTEALRTKGKVERGWLGLRLANAGPDDMRSAFSLPNFQGAAHVGVAIRGLDDKGPAAEAGLRVGDVILMFNDTPIKDTRDLIRQIGDLPPDTMVSLTILREGKEQRVIAKIGVLPGN